ncbi:MAG: aminoacyl-tRNA deacylase [Halochromatium sp.]
MAKTKDPVTAAVRFLRQADVPFSGFCYAYSGGGTAEVAQALGVDEHQVIKTLIMETEQQQPLIMLMHGDREVATGALARQIGAKRVQPCAPQIADKHSGYQVGGTSPFATRRTMPIYCERSILQRDVLYINGGKRGYILRLRSTDLQRLLSPRLVDVAV